MDLTIDLPVGFNETGGRSNNEDCIFPAPGAACISDRLFLVCDGVGGEHKGEVASALACEYISRYFLERGEATVSEAFVQKAVRAAHEAFVKTEEGNPGARGMATTMTLLYLDNEGAVLAHLGDSRIYQVRNGRIIYRTKDHKWVNELVESGVITEEQAREHPQRNVITRVVTASRIDTADYVMLTDVQPDDFFFLCTDGVLEQMYDELLEYHLRDNPDNHPEPAEIMEAIRSECAEKTRDNFSAYLIRIKTCRSSTALVETESGVESAIPEKISETNAGEQSRQSEKPRGILLGLIAFAVVFSVTLLLYFFKDKNANDKLINDVRHRADSLSSKAGGVSEKENAEEVLIDGQEEKIQDKTKTLNEIP